MMNGDGPRNLSKRSSHLREAGILRALTLKVKSFPDGINLGQGVCDLEMPDVLREAAIDSIAHDRATYTNYAGLEVLRKEIARRYSERYDIRYGMDEIVVTTGASGAYMAALMTLIDPGDEIILFEPFYPYHYTAAKLAGARLRILPLELGAEGLDWGGLEDALRREPRLIVLNTPSNPIGRVWTEDEIGRLAQMLAGTSTLVVTDEIYEDLVYDGRRHHPPAAHPDLRDRTITISGLSKAYSITGWRIGWLCAPAALAGAIGPVFDVMVVCAPRPLQKAAAVALRELPPSYYEDLRRGYEKRRGMLAGTLEGAGFPIHVPEGAYYMLADYSGRYGPIDGMEACFKLLDEAHLAAIPGTIFYEKNAPPVLRFQFAVKESVLEEVARRLS